MRFFTLASFVLSFAGAVAVAENPTARQLAERLAGKRFTAETRDWDCLHQVADAITSDFFNAGAKLHVDSDARVADYQRDATLRWEMGFGANYYSFTVENSRQVRYLVTFKGTSGWDRQTQRYRCEMFNYNKATNLLTVEDRSGTQVFRYDHQATPTVKSGFMSNIAISRGGF